MEQRDIMYLLGGGLIVWLLFYMRNANNNNVSVEPGQPTDIGPTVQPQPLIYNQMPYYNLSFSNSGNMFNPLATEYMPLFGFIATRSYF